MVTLIWRRWCSKISTARMWCLGVP
uniref:Uncharacterized protein n=1 Tax=Arundo donax TaxID=35708 RepID=A0A0A9ARM1_ARUDO